MTHIIHVHAQCLADIEMWHHSGYIWNLGPAGFSTRDFLDHEDLHVGSVEHEQTSSQEGETVNQPVSFVEGVGTGEERGVCNEDLDRRVVSVPNTPNELAKNIIFIVFSIFSVFLYFSFFKFQFERRFFIFFCKISPNDFSGKSCVCVAWKQEVVGSAPAQGFFLLFRNATGLLIRVRFLKVLGSNPCQD